jgi:hypothetical protein
VWPGEIPPGWELEWVEDDDWRHHGRPPVMFLTSLSLIPLFSKLWTTLSCQRLQFVIIKPFGVDLDVNYVMYSRLAFAWVLMHICQSLLLCKVISPGVNPATTDIMILYYCLMTKWIGLGDSTVFSWVGCHSWHQSNYMHRRFNNLNHWFLNKICQDCLDLQNTLVC